MKNITEFEIWIKDVKEAYLCEPEYGSLLSDTIEQDLIKLYEYIHFNDTKH